jgi:hypothetical protein
MDADVRRAAVRMIRRLLKLKAEMLHPTRKQERLLEQLTESVNAFKDLCVEAIADRDIVIERLRKRLRDNYKVGRRHEEPEGQVKLRLVVNPDDTGGDE